MRFTSETCCYVDESAAYVWKNSVIDSGSSVAMIKTMTAVSNIAKTMRRVPYALQKKVFKLIESQPVFWYTGDYPNTAAFGKKHYKNPEHTYFHELGHTLYYKTKQNELNLYRYFKIQEKNKIKEVFAEEFAKFLTSIEKKEKIIYNYFIQLLHHLY